MTEPVSGNRWLQLITEKPDHSAWYVERFRSMQAEGKDLFGEARLVDAMVGRGARILDAGCGPGRVGGRLHELGHEVVGVDLDPALIEAANEDYPGPVWMVGDLSELDLTGVFDVIVCAGNVMAFLDPATRRAALERLGAHLAEGGRIVLGFGSGRDYDFEEYFADVAGVGLVEDLRFSTWDMRPFTESSDFLVSVLRSPAEPPPPSSDDGLVR